MLTELEVGSWKWRKNTHEASISVLPYFKRAYNMILNEPEWEEAVVTGTGLK